ncbi:MAG: NAD(P)-dependent oxidoreductase [Alcaligenaceae bacterium]|nr:NAD(P)-dependent oxidoreductase [Alcaligenaceae bacterium]
MTDKKKTIGLIGCGLMGSGIATSLLRNGFPLCILKHEGNQPLDALIAAGATTAARISTLARQVEVVILCVTGTPQVEAVLFGDDGVLQSLQPGTIVIDCSTAIPSSTMRMAQAVRQTGGRFLDAAMTRTPKEAAEGRLNLIVGGTPEDYADCLPLLQAYAEVIVHAGPVGSGHQMKLLHNYVSLGFSAVLAEAAALARLSGADPGLFCEVLAAGGGGGVVLERLRPYIENGDTKNFRFSTANALKDLEYYCAMAESLEGSQGVAQAVRNLYADASAAGWAHAPVPQVIDHLAGQHEPGAASETQNNNGTHQGNKA